MPSTGKRISTLLGKMLPSFVVDEHTTLTNFLIAFFEYIEQEENPYELIANSNEYSDIDKTLDSWVDDFKSQYIQDLPDGIVADARHVIKNIRDYYLSKGNEISYEMLFSLVYGTYVSFYYPKVDILRASDGKWTIPYYIQVDEGSVATALLFDTFIIGLTSGATGYVEEILNIEDPSNIGFFIPVISISNVEGDFAAGETIKDKNSVNTLTIQAVDGVITGQGRYEGTDGQLSSNKRLQDNYYYQDYSYELRTTISIDAYGETVRNLVHPAGMEMFGVVESDNSTAIEEISQDTTWNISWYTDNRVVSNGYTATSISSLSVGKTNAIAYSHYNEYDYDYVAQQLILGEAGNGDHYINSGLNYVDLLNQTVGSFIDNSGRNTTLVSVNGEKLTNYTIRNRTVKPLSLYSNNDILSVFSLGSPKVTPWRLSGDGSSTVFPLGALYNINELIAYVDGIKQNFTTGAYISGSNIVFTTPPSDAIENIEIYQYSRLRAPEKISGDGTQKNFVLGSIPRRNQVNALLVFVDGKHTKVNINNKTNTIIFDDAPSSGTDNIEVLYLKDVSRINDYITMNGSDTEYYISDITNKFRLRSGSEITIQ